MKNKFHFTALVSSIVFFSFSLFVFLFFYKLINDKDEILQQSQLELQTETFKREEMRQLDRTMRAIAEERTLLESHFVENSDVVPLLNTIESLASSVSVKAEISSVDTSKDGSSLSVGVRAGGDFESLYKFFTLLENSIYELEFESFNLQKSSAQSDAEGAPISEWDASVKIKVLTFLPS